MKIFIGVMTTTGVIVWMLIFAWLIGYIANKLGVYDD